MLGEREVAHTWRLVCCPTSVLRDGLAVDGLFFLFFPFWFQADTQHFYSDLRIRDDLSVCLRLCFCRIELAQSVLAYPSLWVHSGGVLTMMMIMMTMISANRYELHVCFECISHHPTL